MLGNIHQSNLPILVRFVFGALGVAFAMINQVDYAMMSLIIVTILTITHSEIDQYFEYQEDALSFGLELEVLADFIGYGLVPAAILQSLAGGAVWGVIVAAIYMLAVGIRLSHFNRPQEFQGEQVELDHSYLGLPILAVVPVLAILLLIHFFAKGAWLAMVLAVLLLILAVGYVMARPIPKLTKEQWRYTVMGLIVVLIVFLAFSIFL